MTQEQGKTVAEAKAEILNGADTIDWFAEEGRRTYGRVIPARGEGDLPARRQGAGRSGRGVHAVELPDQPDRAQALGGARRRLLDHRQGARGDAGVAGRADPRLRRRRRAGRRRSTSSTATRPRSPSYLIPHPVIRKISFTGSTVVGKQLAALAGQHMKRVTMELGGHAPVIVFDDADAAVAAKVMAASKFRNAGQVCISPTRFLVQEGIYDELRRAVRRQREGAQGRQRPRARTSRMGALANPRRSTAMEVNLEDAGRHGGEGRAGGHRIGDKGNFWEPTVVTELPNDAKAMNEEPFGPMAIINPFRTFDDAVKEANRLPFGLAAYAWTKSAKTANAIASSVETGMISINHVGLGIPETPFGGVKDSGYGSEGGSEAIESYLNPKFVSQAGL